LAGVGEIRPPPALGVFALIDHIEADLALQAHDLRHRGAQRRFVGEVGKARWFRKAAELGGEHAMVAGGHDGLLLEIRAPG
jgi:hypothetical protein